jgi:hypothetical protein
MTSPGAIPAGWMPSAPAANGSFASGQPNQVVLRAGAPVWSWIHARLQEPNTITGVLVALLVIIILFQHPLARAIGTESPPAALSGPTDSAAPAVAPVAPSSVASLGHAWSKLPDVVQRNPFQPLLGESGVVQSPVAIGPAPQNAAAVPRHRHHPSATQPQRHTGNGSGQTGSSSAGGGSCAASHVVRAGDSLWSIADSDLTSRGYKSVDAAVHALYSTNRAKIGPDPSYLVPGQRLCLPKA